MLTILCYIVKIFYLKTRKERGLSHGSAVTKVYFQGATVGFSASPSGFSKTTCSQAVVVRAFNPAEAEAGGRQNSGVEEMTLVYRVPAQTDYTEKVCVCGMCVWVCGGLCEWHNHL